MKKALIFILTAILTFTLAGTASAASGGVQPVHVNVDGQAIAFESAPTLVNNKMYIEAGEILEELGFDYEIEEGTGTIFATSEDREIQLSAGGDIAIVNGWSVDGPGEVIEQDGATLLGLRFIATLAGYSVDWDKPTRTALLVNEGPTAEERAALYDAFNRLLLIEASGDVTGLAGLFAADSPLDVKGLQDEWTRTKTKTTFLKKMVEYYSDEEAIVYVYDETVKVSGGFFPENASKVRYTLHREEDGGWKIYNVETSEIVLLDEEGLYDQAVATVPEADKAEIGKLLEDQVKANNEENVDAYLATMAPSELNEQTRQGLEELFEAVDSIVTTERWAIVDYDSAAGTATLLTTLKTDVEAYGQKVAVRTTSTSGLEKVDGKWLFSTEESVILNQVEL